MVQLTLLQADGPTTVRERLAVLESRWSSSLGAADHAAQAARVTASRFSIWGARPLDAQEQARVSAYFRAVLRRRILNTPDQAAASARRLLVATSIEADLKEAGWDACRAAAEAQRITGVTVGYGGAA